MNKVFNPNNIFAFPLKAYDLQNVFFCKELLKERFFCISEDYESSFYRSPNALREAYRIVLEEDVMNYIKKLDKHIYECILFNFLYKIKDELETLSFDEFNKILTDEEIKKSLKISAYPLIKTILTKMTLSTKKPNLCKSPRIFIKMKIYANLSNFAPIRAIYSPFAKNRT